MAKTQKNEEVINIAKTLNNVPWCDDYERMISGMLYNCEAKELEKGRFRARKWCHRYNTWFPDDDKDNDGQEVTFETLAKERNIQLSNILGSVGDAFIEPPFRFDYGCNIRLGERFYANFNLTILDCALVTIGKRAMFGPNVSIFAATHETSVQSRRDNVEYALPVTIGDDCWIGGHVVIIGPVVIGDGVTVAAGSVVTKDIPSWSVAVGTPARVVKKVEALEDVEERKIGFAAKDRIG